MTEKTGTKKLLLIIYSAYHHKEGSITFRAEAYTTQSHTSEVTILCMKIESLFKNTEKKGLLGLFSSVDRKIGPTLPMILEIKKCFEGHRRYLKDTGTVLYEAVVPEEIYLALLRATKPGM